MTGVPSAGKVPPILRPPDEPARQRPRRNRLPARARRAGRGPLDAAPAVVVVLVTRNPGPFLESALEGLRSQDYPTLSVLVVDAGSTVDPGPRVAAALPDAFVHRGPGSRPGFGGAANEALELVDGAAFFLVCHDDVVLAPDAIRLLVEEAYRSNAAIVGPKLVSSDDPEVLLEVGRSIDRLGGSHTGIEPGRARPRAARRGPRRLLRLERRAARARRPVRRAGRLRSRDVPRLRGPRPLLAGPPRRRPGRRRPRRPGRARRGRRGASPR